MNTPRSIWPILMIMLLFGSTLDGAEPAPKRLTINLPAELHISGKQYKTSKIDDERFIALFENLIVNFNGMINPGQSSYEIQVAMMAGQHLSLKQERHTTMNSNEDELAITITSSEIRILINGLNESIENLDEWEYHVRMGCEISEARELIQRLRRQLQE